MADKVAAAVLEWATENDATSFTHAFQPQGASGVRHGLPPRGDHTSRLSSRCAIVRGRVAAPPRGAGWIVRGSRRTIAGPAPTVGDRAGLLGMVQNAFFKFDNDGVPVWDLKGKDLIQGETDGSSYANGGLRGTHCAGGYVQVDPSSPIYLRGDTIFIPSCLVSYFGDALDEKTPLLRSVDALNREGKRLLSLMGYDVPGLQSNIGLEQEFFLMPRDDYTKRQDIMLAGRTIMGADAPRGPTESRIRCSVCSLCGAATSARASFATPASPIAPSHSCSSSSCATQPAIASAPSTPSFAKNSAAVSSW